MKADKCTQFPLLRKRLLKSSMFSASVGDQGLAEHMVTEKEQQSILKMSQSKSKLKQEPPSVTEQGTQSTIGLLGTSLQGSIGSRAETHSDVLLSAQIENNDLPPPPTQPTPDMTMANMSLVMSEIEGESLLNSISGTEEANVLRNSEQETSHFEIQFASHNLHKPPLYPSQNESDSVLELKPIIVDGAEQESKSLHVTVDTAIRKNNSQKPALSKLPRMKSDPLSKIVDPRLKARLNQIQNYTHTSENTEAPVSVDADIENLRKLQLTNSSTILMKQIEKLRMNPPKEPRSAFEDDNLVLKEARKQAADRAIASTTQGPIFDMKSLSASKGQQRLPLKSVVFVPEKSIYAIPRAKNTCAINDSTKNNSQSITDISKLSDFEFCIPDWPVPLSMRKRKFSSSILQSDLQNNSTGNDSKESSVQQCEACDSLSEFLMNFTDIDRIRLHEKPLMIYDFESR